MPLTLGPVIGRLGGGMDVIDVSITNVTGSGTRHALHTAEVTPGHSILVSIDGVLEGPTGATTAPAMFIGDKTSGVFSLDTHGSMAAVITATTEVGLLTRNSSPSNAVSFTGKVYVMEMPK